MFSFFKRFVTKRAPVQRPRGVQPTYVTHESVVLCKAATEIRNTYEIRLALFMAMTRKAQFVLSVRQGTKVDPKLASHLKQHGGVIRETEITDYSVYVFHLSPTEEEGDGWVLGDASALAGFHSALNSHWLRQRLVVGSSVTGPELARLEAELRSEASAQKNIDGENLLGALARLATEARASGGSVVVQ